MNRKNFNEIVEKAKFDIKAIEGCKESIVLSISRILGDQKIILDLCARLEGVQNALQDVADATREPKTRHNADEAIIEFGVEND